MDRGDVRTSLHKPCPVENALAALRQADVRATSDHREHDLDAAHPPTVPDSAVLSEGVDNPDQGPLIDDDDRIGRRLASEPSSGTSSVRNMSVIPFGSQCVTAGSAKWWRASPSPAQSSRAASDTSRRTGVAPAVRDAAGGARLHARRG